MFYSRLFNGTVDPLCFTCLRICSYLWYCLLSLIFFVSMLIFLYEYCLYPSSSIVSSDFLINLCFSVSPFKIHHAYLFHVNLSTVWLFLTLSASTTDIPFSVLLQLLLLLVKSLIFSYSDHLTVSHSVQPPSFHSCGFTTLECPPICPSCLSRLLPCPVSTMKLFFSSSIL